MVKVLLRQRDPENLEEWKEVDLYLDGYIKPNLDLGIKQLKDDFDQVWFIDGAEGAGKSDLMAQLAYYVNKEETRHTLIDRICTTAETFDAAILKAEAFEAVVLDEAFGAMSATGSMGKINKVLQRRFTEIRSKNLFVFIGAPSFMDIMRYFAIWRSKCLLHVYLGKDRRRGFAAFYGEKKKRKLYILGKKNFYNYSIVAPQFTFRFTKQMHKVLDKEAYDIKKRSIQSNTIAEDRSERIAKKQKEIHMKVTMNMRRNNPTMTQREIARQTGITEKSVGIYLKEIRENLLGNGGLTPLSG